ncbi:unnamed protein product [Heligmosomoides polygyrus]|uniref:DUF148 domain-containing protein n=1 Tax=Heligmosomoides polygyrus TaxID=6339 RepID=A0A3P8EF48_HELPZ|nr:unnamed protein product [Heligmosomoides polygyrus]
MDAAQLLLLLILVFAVVQSVMVEGFNLNFVTLEPSPKPPFLANATSEAIKQFMAILRLPGIARARKANELDVMVGTLRSEVQLSYQDYKAEALLLKLTHDERLQEIVEKTHYAMVHLDALRASKTLRVNERKKRLEMMFAEFSDFMVRVQAVTVEVADVIDNVMQQVLRALLFTERMTQR